MKKTKSLKKHFFCVLLLFFWCSVALAQTTIEGTVSDSQGLPLPGVNIAVQGTSTGTVTDFDGKFSIQVEPGVVLEISYLGFEPKEIPIGNQKTLNIVLEESMESLQGVVVTAQGIEKSKRALGYAVAEVDSEEVEMRPEADLARSLQGKVAGVTISQQSGQSGSSSPIRIRGSISLTQANSPLIVVNNVPFSGLLRDLNPNNIESIQILKGFSASVLYGSEGRNGVILIQTKSGSPELGKEETTVSVSSTTYVNLVSQLPEFQNKYGQGQEGEFLTTFVSVWGPAFGSMEEVPHPYSNLTDIFPEYDTTVPYTAKEDNIKNIFKTGIGTIFSANVSTTKENVGYNISAGYTSEEGIIAHNDVKRFNIGLGGEIRATENLNLSATLNYSTNKVNRVQSRDIFNVIYYLPRNVDLTKLPYQHPVTGESVYYRNDTNPLWMLHNSQLRDDQVRVYGTFNANYQLGDAFNFTYRIGYDSEQLDTFDYSNKGGYDNNAFRTGFLNLYYRKRVIVDQTLLASYNQDLTDDINLEAQVGINSKLTNFKSISSDSQGQIVYGFLRPSNYSTTQSDYYSSNENLAGVFGQFQFAFKNYLYATLSGRNDWGSTVETENQSLFYPGVSLSFIPTSAFDFGGDIVNYLKLRGAYGTSSGYPGPYRTRNTLIIDAFRFATPGGVLPVTNRFSSIFANPDLKPELHREFEIGIEAALFNNRVTLETSLYKRISEDQIVESPLAPATGFDIQYINLGRVDNEGVEVNLGIDVIKSDNFNWNLRNVFFANESLVVTTTPSGADINLRVDRWAVEGEPLGVIKGDYALRDDEGNLIISGNGGSTRVGEVISSSDVGLENKIIGDPNPDWRLTTINSLSYKNFTLSAQLEYTHGGEISSRAVEQILERGVTRDTENRGGSFVIPGVLGDDDTGELLLDPEGNKIPNTIQLNGLRTTYSNYYNANDLSMWDASVFRLREIALGYNLTKKQFPNLPFDSVGFRLSGRNLYFVAPNFPKYMNYDPESDGGLGRENIPSTKRFALGISATF